MKRWQKETYEYFSPVGKITLDALDLARAHTRWKMGKGSMRSFSRNKDKFIKAITRTLYLWRVYDQKP